MKVNTSLRASACVRKRQRASSSHSSVAKKLLTHGIVIGVAHRTHGRTYSCFAATKAEPDRCILRTLVRVVDHVVRPSLRQCHVQCIEYHLSREHRGH